MLNQPDFRMKSTILISKLQVLWWSAYQVMTVGPTPERLAGIAAQLHEVDQLHRELFPEFEHSLYSDDFMSMIEGDEHVDEDD